MYKRMLLIVCTLCMLCSRGLYGQTTQKRIMNIDELFTLAEENSKSINSSKIGTQAAEEDLKAAKSSRLPDINVSISGSYIGNGYISDRHFDNGLSVSMPHWGNNFSLSVAQIIYAGGAVKSAVDLAELKKNLSNLNLNKNRQNVRFMLVGQYLDICKILNQQEIMEQNIRLTERIIENTKQRASEGTVLKNDITRYELQLENMNLQLRKLTDAYSILNHQIVNTIGLKEGTEIIPQKGLHENLPEITEEQNWQKSAYDNNIDIKQADIATEMNQKALKIERSEQLPKIIMMAENHMDGPILIEVPVINKNFNYWFVGIGIKYNLSSLFKNNKRIKQASLLIDQSKQNSLLARESINNIVQASFTDYMTSIADCHTQEKSVELATKNYNVINNRYESGLALLTDMLDASNMKLNAELSLVNARISIIYNYYKMRYNSSTL